MVHSVQTFYPKKISINGHLTCFPVEQKQKVQPTNRASEKNRIRLILVFSYDSITLHRCILVTLFIPIRYGRHYYFVIFCKHTFNRIKASLIVKTVNNSHYFYPSMHFFGNFFSIIGFRKTSLASVVHRKTYENITKHNGDINRSLSFKPLYVIRNECA